MEMVEYYRSLRKERKEGKGRKRKRENRESFPRSVYASFIGFLRIFGAKLRGELGQAEHQGS